MKTGQSTRHLESCERAYRWHDRILSSQIDINTLQQMKTAIHVIGLESIEARLEAVSDYKLQKL